MTRNPTDYASEAGIVRAHDYQQRRRPSTLADMREEAQERVQACREGLRNAKGHVCRQAWRIRLLLEIRHLGRINVTHELRPKQTKD